jgi:translation initiation factor 2-alpha kinase 4
MLRNPTKIKSGKGGKRKSLIDKQPIELYQQRRCAVLVASFDAETLRSLGLKVLSSLWQAKISAELATDASSLEDLGLLYSRRQEHSFLVLIKKSDVAWGAIEVRVKSLLRDDITAWQQPGAEVSLEGLVAYLRIEMAGEHGPGLDPTSGLSAIAPLLDTNVPISSSTAAASSGLAAVASITADSPVRFLRADVKTKKMNRAAVIDAARSAAANLLTATGLSTILAVDLSDSAFESVAKTRLSDPDTWRKTRDAEQADERLFLTEVQEFLMEERKKGRAGHAVLFQFKSGAVALYDLKA